MKILVSGLINIETTLKISHFPISYYPIDYPFFGIHSNVSGVGYNISRALCALGNEAILVSYLGNDEEGERILRCLADEGISHKEIRRNLRAAPVSVVLYDGEGKRQIYCDLKDIQEQQLPAEELETALESCELVAACNINFNRTLIRRARETHYSHHS